jgi:hypothetical protein
VFALMRVRYSQLARCASRSLLNRVGNRTHAQGNLQVLHPIRRSNAESSVSHCIMPPGRGHADDPWMKTEADLACQNPPPITRVVHQVAARCHYSTAAHVRRCLTRYVNSLPASMGQLRIFGAIPKLKKFHMAIAVHHELFPYTEAPHHKRQGGSVPPRLTLDASRVTSNQRRNDSGPVRYSAAAVSAIPAY